MDPITAAALIGAAGGIGESIISGFGQHSANRANRDAAREQMAFQERMSSTARQRDRADLEKAGYNPLYWMGSASTPAGAMATSGNVGESARGTTAKAFEARANQIALMNAKADVELKRKQGNALNIDSVNKMSDSLAKDALRDLYKAQTLNVGSTTALNVLEQQKLGHLLHGLATEADIDKSKYGKFLRYLDRTTSTVGSAIGLINSKAVNPYNFLGQHIFAGDKRTGHIFHNP